MLGTRALHFAKIVIFHSSDDGPFVLRLLEHLPADRSGQETLLEEGIDPGWKPIPIDPRLQDP